MNALGHPKVIEALAHAQESCVDSLHNFILKLDGAVGPLPGGGVI